jgi:dihydropteroate synthase
VKDTFFYSKKTLNANGKIIDLSVPIVMGILNVTPDSFYDGGKYTSEKSILERVEKMLFEGAGIIDIGGYSSRPNAHDISIEEELTRVVPFIKKIKQEFPDSIVSIDTFRSEVARKSIDAGADIINDISGGSLDPEMFQTVSDLKVPYILMHMKGTPQTMVKLSQYQNMMVELIDYFQQKINQLQNLGVTEIVIDPGLGFAKTMDQNYELIRKLTYFNSLNFPILVGLSRKSMIYKTLGVSPEDTLNGTTVLNTIALMNGASILRVHDVKECVEAVKLFKSVYP